jgi:hypothetical protein
MISVLIGSAIGLLGFLSAGAAYEIGRRHGRHIEKLATIARLDADDHAGALRKLHEKNRAVFSGRRRVN